MSKIQESLQRLFEKYRIIIWYDGDQHFTAEYGQIEIGDVIKREINNNEFALKHLVLLEAPESKFLLYSPQQRPVNEENWLLDIELANHIFETNQEALFLQELGLPYSLRHWIQRHSEFFKSKERLQKFAAEIDKADSEQILTAKMLRLVTGALSFQLDEILKAYATAFVNDKHEAVDKELIRFGLKDELWELVGYNYQYESSEPSIYDFLLELFQKGFGPYSSRSKLNSSARVLIAAWKDARSFEITFRKLSEKIATDLNLNADISNITMEELLEEDVFELVDRKIIKELTTHIGHQSLSAEKVEQIIKQRETKYWRDTYFSYYEAINFANLLLGNINHASKVSMNDYEQGFNRYTSEWYQIDQYYRLFLQYYRATGQNNVFASLYNEVHKAYSNTWLLELNNQWQKTIDQSGGWYFGPKSQQKFYTRDIKPRYVDKGIKVFVVISDALRFECGKALHNLFVEEARFVSSLEYQISGLPSYTQLGMASLIPHSTLSFGKEDEILIDGKSTMGAQARKKILEENSGVRSTTINAEELMKLPTKGQEAQNLIQQHDIIYVYHNRIDKLGDDKTSEDKVIEACDEEIEFLVEVARKISNMNGYHIVFTADHGFVYQHEPLEESDFTDAEITGDIIKENRRFVIGKNLNYNDNVAKYQARDLQIDSDCEVLIPKSINRLRVKGAGSRFIHGGSTLQETVVPVLFVNKKKTDTVTKVEIDVLNKGNNRITTNLHTVKFYQQQSVGGSILPRTVKCYFAMVEGDEIKPISDIFNYTFDLDEKRAEDREVTGQFRISTHLKQSQNIYLMVDEQVEGSTKWNTILKLPYSLNLTMENDFDEF